MGSNHARLSVLSNDLGRVLQRLGDPVGAREHFENALRIDQKIYGGNDIHLTSAVNNHAITLHSDGDFSAARERLEQALATAEFHYGSGADDGGGGDRRVALIRNNLACVLRDSGDVAGAQIQFEKALEEARLAMGDSTPLVAQIAFNLGEMLHRLGELSAAHPLLELAMQIDSTHHTADHPDVLRDTRELALLRQQLVAATSEVQAN